MREAETQPNQNLNFAARNFINHQLILHRAILEVGEKLHEVAAVREVNTQLAAMPKPE